MQNASSPFVIASLKLFSCLLLCLLVALVGGWFAEEASFDWYAGLQKPAWAPPAWIFPLVSTPLYILMGLSLWLITMKTDMPRPNFWPYFWFFIQLALNLAWSPAFFFYECSFCAALILTALVFAIVMTMISFHKYVKVAAYLLIPYLIWILYAGLLNYTLYLKN